MAFLKPKAPWSKMMSVRRAESQTRQNYTLGQRSMIRPSDAPFLNSLTAIWEDRSHQVLLLPSPSLSRDFFNNVLTCHPALGKGSDAVGK